MEAPPLVALRRPHAAHRLAAHQRPRRRSAQAPPRGLGRLTRFIPLWHRAYRELRLRRYLGERPWIPAQPHPGPRLHGGRHGSCTRGRVCRPPARPEPAAADGRARARAQRGAPELRHVRYAAAPPGRLRPVRVRVQRRERDALLSVARCVTMRACSAERNQLTMCHRCWVVYGYETKCAYHDTLLIASFVWLGVDLLGPFSSPCCCFLTSCSRTRCPENTVLGVLPHAAGRFIFCVRACRLPLCLLFRCRISSAICSLDEAASWRRGGVRSAVVLSSKLLRPIPLVSLLSFSVHTS